MIDIQNAKFISVVAPVAVDDDTYTATEIDTLGFDYLTVQVMLGSVNATLVACKLQASDTSGSGFVDVLDVDGGTDIDGGTAALPVDDANGIIVFQVDLRGRPRYYDLVVTSADTVGGTFLSASAILTRAELKPLDIAGTGTSTVLRI